MLNTVQKIGPVLELFTRERPEWRVTEIARELGMPKSSAHALVTSLAGIGLLSPGSGGRYRLGWNLLSLSERMRASLNFGEHAIPPMHQLSRALRETVLLAALDRTDVVYVERVEGNHPTVRVAGVGVGSRLPAQATAVGKVLLAARDPAEVRALMAAAAMPRFTSTSVTSLEALEAQLDEVRARGYALYAGEFVPDIMGVAAPVRDRHGEAVAAMSVSVPAYRFGDRRHAILDALLATCAEVSRRLAGPREHAA